MTIDEQRIAGELRLIAAEARPVDAAAYARRAQITQRRRRRLTWSVAVFAVTASLAAAKFVGLPHNTPEQLQFVGACMPQGGPVHSMDGNLRIPEQGSAKAFRLLVEYRDQAGSSALVGSQAGFVLCTPATQKDFAERAVFTYWGFKPPGDSTDFSGPLQVDAYTAQTDSHAVGPERSQQDDVYRIVAGRVTADVRRVEIDWADGRRADAQMANGFFIARIPGKLAPDPTGNGNILQSPAVVVTAYDARGQVLQQEKNVAIGPLGRKDG